MLTITSLGVAAIGRLTLSLTWAAATNIALYLGAYFVRLRLMSRLAKSDDHAAGWRYFVEEQLVSTPAAFVGLAILAWSGVADFREGFTDVPRGPQWPWAAIIGILSQGTGVFGALVLLDKAENTFSVPVNRASSVLAGVVASLFLWSALAGPPIPVRELLAAALVVIAIVVLTLPDSKKRRT
jgi:drug/metabolite transporter (DMT)-like permease